MTDFVHQILRQPEDFRFKILLIFYPQSSAKLADCDQHEILCQRKWDVKMDVTKIKKKWLTPTQSLILVISAFIMLTGNLSFYQKVTEAYPWQDGNAGFLISLFVLFTAAPSW